jgi:hypothetical protein
MTSAPSTSNQSRTHCCSSSNVIGAVVASRDIEMCSVTLCAPLMMHVITVAYDTA